MKAKHVKCSCGTVFSCVGNVKARVRCGKCGDVLLAAATYHPPEKPKPVVIIDEWHTAKWD